MYINYKQKKEIKTYKLKKEISLKYSNYKKIKKQCLRD